VNARRFVILALPPMVLRQLPESLVAALPEPVQQRLRARREG
jgi:hypothetical protein